MKNLGNNRYQVTIYISSQSDMGENDIEFYQFLTQKSSDQFPLTALLTLSGDDVGTRYGAGIIWPMERGLVSVSVNGHYRITLDLSGGWGAATAHVEKLND
jgi:hypothetical protein